MNLKLKSFIVIVDLVACSLEKMLSDKIKIQIIFFFKKKISNICTNTIHVACHCVIFIYKFCLYRNKHGENFKQEWREPYWSPETNTTL